MKNLKKKFKTLEEEIDFLKKKAKIHSEKQFKS